MHQDPPSDAEQKGPGVRVRAAPDGTLTYLVDNAPETLPAVCSRDLEAAWDAARSAARAARWDGARLFRFLRGDGTHTDLALADVDARCWAGAVDRTVGIHTRYGLSLCLRLLALVDLLTRADWTENLFRLRPDGAEIDVSLLRAAAYTPLNGEARFDEARLRDLIPRTALAPPPCHTGACR